MPNWGKDFTEGLKAGRAVRKSWDEGRKEDEERAWRLQDAERKTRLQWEFDNHEREGKGLDPLPEPKPYQEPRGWDKVKDILGLGPVRPVPPASARGWASTLSDLLQSGTATDAFGGEAEAALTAGAPRSPRAFIHAGGLPRVAGTGAGGTMRTGGRAAPVVAGPYGDMIGSLLKTESKGADDWGAVGPVTRSGERAYGRLQFMPTRLADASQALGRQIDPQAFLRDPALQQQVEQWHFADLDRQIAAAGLDRLIGQNVGGYDVTANGLRAGAHLGGFGGLQQFLETRGGHNPSDGRTRIGDYLSVHAGGTWPGAVAAPSAQQAPSVAARPIIPLPATLRGA